MKTYNEVSEQVNQAVRRLVEQARLKHGNDSGVAFALGYVQEELARALHRHPELLESSTLFKDK